MDLAVIIATGIELYLALGVGFAVWFAAQGATRLDPVAGAGSVGFRLLLVPGATVLWPYLLYRSIVRGPAPPIERNAHRRRARAHNR